MSAESPSLHRYRAIWISDIHLGTRGCKAEFLLDFLKYTESEYLYLVGDIIDIWRLRRNWYWMQTHNDVIQKLLRKARKGTRLYYIPGNHDEKLRDFGKHRFGRVTVMNEAIHVAADGKRYLVMHGDQYDAVVLYARWLALTGDWAYNLLLAINHHYNIARRALGFGYWSLSAYLKHKVKDAVDFISHFEDAVVDEARSRDLDGVICGHIHTAALKDIDGITYANDGDWVESCTALVEHMDGRLEIIDWMAMQQLSPLDGRFEDSEKLPAEKAEQCVSSSSLTPGFLRSMASYARLLRSSPG
ncbi:UDP-2,3-diacylglucosamine diphosphatase [Alphaproteobacteria bacterium HT1-32]|nr:UDP-2,3-diacylglucosamine diphosphatase [Alphaproteobacteria bacterium HT1-32]